MKFAAFNDRCVSMFRLLCSTLYYFYKTEVEMIKFVPLMAKYLTNNPQKVYRKNVQLFFSKTKFFS